jgi:hypothetical protein
MQAMFERALEPRLVACGGLLAVLRHTALDSSAVDGTVVSCTLIPPVGGGRGWCIGRLLTRAIETARDDVVSRDSVGARALRCTADACAHATVHRTHAGVS